MGETTMRHPKLYDRAARRKTVSITMNADLAARAAAAGINMSRTAEAAVAAALDALERARILADLREAAAFTAVLVAEHGPAFDDWTAELYQDAPAPGAAGPDDAA